ncbi:MAG: hypothetical protein OXC12_01755 [Spirochaetaceae bacterium]|nr:hypothetical protein [Spirochaetaceae bacterium]
MSDSDGHVSVERESVETMLEVLKRLRGIFNSDLDLLKQNAPGIGAFAERTESGIARLQAVLDGNSGASLSLPRDVVESMIARFKRFRGNFNTDTDELQELAPGIARFVKRLEAATEKLKAAL